MKTILFAVFVSFSFVSIGQVGIGTTSPDVSAKLEVSASNKGFLPPRVLLTGTLDVITIPIPATGLLVYNTNTAGNVTPGYYYYNGTSWTRVPSQLDHLTDVKFSGTNFTGSMLVGNETTGTLNLATENVGIGVDVFRLMTSGKKNVGVGYQALYRITSGNYNNAIGYLSMGSNSTGFYNVAMGGESLYSNTSGMDNVAIGDYAGYSNTTGSKNVFIGSSAGPGAADLSDAIAIGYNAKVTSSNSIQLGDPFITSVRTQGTIYVNNVALTSDARLKSNITDLPDGLSTVMQLHPYQYQKKRHFLDQPKDPRTERGFLAQDVRNVLPDLVSAAPDADSTLSVNYVELIPVLTKAIQEQQQLIKQQQELIQQQSAGLKTQQQHLEQLESMMTSRRVFRRFKKSDS